MTQRRPGWAGKLNIEDLNANSNELQRYTSFLRRSRDSNQTLALLLRIYNHNSPRNTPTRLRRASYPPDHRFVAARDAEHSEHACVSQAARKCKASARVVSWLGVGLRWPMVIGADHNNWRNLVQSGDHPPLFAKGCSLGRRGRSAALELEEASRGCVSVVGRPRQRSKEKKGEEWKKAKERSGDRARAVRARNRFPRVKPSSRSRNETLLCVHASTRRYGTSVSWLSFVARRAAKRETFAFRYSANLATSSSLSELVHRRERNETTSRRSPPFYTLRVFNLRPSSVEARRSQATRPLSFLGCLVACLAAC